MKEHALVSGVFVGPAGVTFSIARDTIECTWDGVKNDRHYGRTKPAGGRERYVPKGTAVLNIRQVSIVSGGELTEIARLMNVPEVTGPDLGANLVLKIKNRRVFLLQQKSRYLYREWRGIERL